jgi:creatinine amidohydrolase/Fe(II)-dependent formamide hydrolase-like protein
MKKNTSEEFNIKDGHAAWGETARIMSIRPDLVHMDECNPEGLKRLGRSDHLQDISTPMDWYANFPTHQAGDPSPASGAMGDRMIDFEVEFLVRRIREIKADNAIEKLLGEFYQKSGEPLA